MSASAALLEVARSQIGVWEWKEGSNPQVLKYYQAAGHDITDDATPWCAAFVGWCLGQLALPNTGSLLARSYEKYGDPVKAGDWQPGDIVVIPRGNSSWQGHVFFINKVKPDGSIEGLGGNQNDGVTIKTFSAHNVLAVRRAKLPRKSPAQSTTAWAQGGAGAAVCGTAATVLPQLDQVAQYMVLGFLGAGGLLILYTMRERLKSWFEKGNR